MILSKHSETTSEIKVKPMPIQVDIRKTFLYKWGREEGIREGIKKGEQRGLVGGSETRSERRNSGNCSSKVCCPKSKANKKLFRKGR